MIAYIIIFLTGLSISFFLTPVLRKRLIEKGFVDKPDARKIHKRAIPNMGGITIYLGFILSLAVSFIFYPKLFVDRELQLLGLFIASTFIVIVGIIDDIYNIRAVWKLLLQIAAGIILILFGYQIEAIANPFGSNIELGLFNYPLTIFWVVGIINAINLVDGLDGLASGVGMIVAMTIFLIGIYLDKSYVALLSMGLTGAILGFLRHNFYPAKIFMGDTGSMFIGLVIASMGLISSQKSAVSFAIITPLIALGYPLTDIALAIIRRVKAKKHIFIADREHIHHILLSYGYSHPKTVIFLYVICLFFGTMAFLFSAFSQSSSFIIGVLFFVLLFVFLFIKLVQSFKHSADLHEEHETHEKSHTDSEQ